MIKNLRSQSSSGVVNAGCPSHRQLLIKLSLQKVIGLGQTLCSPPSERLKRHGGFHDNQQQMSWVLNATASRNRSTPGRHQPRCPPQVGAIAFSSWPLCSTFLSISQNKVIPAAPLTRTQEGLAPLRLTGLITLFVRAPNGGRIFTWLKALGFLQVREAEKVEVRKKSESLNSPLHLLPVAPSLQ